MDEPKSGLHPQIQHNIIQSEIDGGVWMKDVPVGSSLHIQTKNTLYRLRRDTEGDWSIMGHLKYCPVWTKVSVAGSTWGGSMLKVKFIGRGMHMEFYVAGFSPITTTAIASIEEVRP